MHENLFAKLSSIQEELGGISDGKISGADGSGAGKMCIRDRSVVASVVLVKPLGKITHSMEDLSKGDVEEIVSVSDYTETKAISDAYNNMIRRIRKQEDSRQEFVSNVSHELKTPLTSRCV